MYTFHVGSSRFFKVHEAFMHAEKVKASVYVSVVGGNGTLYRVLQP